MANKSAKNKTVIDNFILYLTHAGCTHDDLYDKPQSFTAKEMYEACEDYISVDHVDGEDNPEDHIEFNYLTFKPTEIKADIMNFFAHTINQNDELWLYKVNTNLKTVGDTFVNTFVYRNGVVCKEIVKGNRAFYKEL